MNNPTDTLDIKPLQPFGVAPQADPTPPATPGSPPNPGATSLSQARDQTAADAARAIIASLPDLQSPPAVTQTDAETVHTVPPSASVAALTPQPEVAPTPIQTAPVDDSLPLPAPAMLLHPTPNTPVDASSQPATNTTKPKRTVKLPSRTKPIALAVGSFALLIVLFKSPVIISQIKYLSGSKNQTPITTPAPVAEVIPPESTLSIPKINVAAPLVFEPSVAEAAVQKALEGGVVHYGDTPAPGEPGNSVIVGHSSNDWWEPGNYKFVFVLLDKLVVGDTFSINYQSKKYVYQVTESKVVEPTDLSVLAPTDTPTVTIITCTPPGTSWKRLIIKAKQTSPNPATAQAVSSTSPATTALPGSAPSWLDQLKSFWNNLFGKKTSTADSNANPASSGAALPGAK